MSASLPSAVVFGSLAPWPSVEQLNLVHKTLYRPSVRLGTLVTALQELPAFWERLFSCEASLCAVNGGRAADGLARWAATGDASTFCGERSLNMLTLPMTIVGHICQYLMYLQHHQDGPLAHAAVLESIAKAGGSVQGFCAGLLSTHAIGGARDEEDIGIRASLVIRLAFAIGAYVDLDALSQGATNALAVRVKSPEGLDTIQAVLDRYAGAYISAQKDSHDATITAPVLVVADLSKELANLGITVLNTGLTGRYHSPTHQGVPEKILRACGLHEDTEITLKRGWQKISLDPGGAETIRAMLHSILLEKSNWHSVIASVASTLHDIKLHRHGAAPFILSIGTDAVPLSISRDITVVKANATLFKADNSQLPSPTYPEHAIAVIGMSCKFPGADSVDEFWELLTEGKSMLEQVPSDRWPETAANRPTSGKASTKPQKFWGNFLSDVDCFDHRFFKKSAREAASMDPQQRLLLQAAYEAMESSGYLAPGGNKCRDIGCYLGLCATDYDANVASHAPNAFSTLGTLRAFLSGKISHFFGWSGPSLTFDTACSSSAVAIHTACRALQADECSQAVAGGVALFTSPYLYENLSAAHFLSPTGATKPFDAKADGYCRGEGLGLVVLKKLSAAMADGDNILGVIGGSAINQNNNCVPITVPHSTSQATLYHKVARQAAVSPMDVSFVEAHGTGTPVGDPIEMESIRNVFGGSSRRSPLLVSSVKGNIGHLEGASGVAGLIKAILQIQNRTVAAQASYSSLNPKIPSLEPDRMAIPTRNQALPAGRLTACINNYGAAGSNSAIMIIEAPRRHFEAGTAQEVVFPIVITANSSSSLLSYCEELRKYCEKRATISLPSLAFSLAKRQNQDLQHAFLTSAFSMPQLLDQLSKLSGQQIERPKPKPLILAFGGQVNNHVGLNKQLWEQSSLLRYHLDQCDRVLRSLGTPGLYPVIFETVPVTDLVSLHSMVFALQYASARAWIDSGLKVDAVIGHSLGQLTALCVCGTLTLEDGLKFVTGRAELMKKHWGSEPGAMIAVEADMATLSSIMMMRQAQAQAPSLEVACYNGPTSHVLVGDGDSVNSFAQDARDVGLKFKRLNVTNGFHSRFVDAMVPHLEELASELTFHTPSIPIETCSESQSWSKPTARLLADHTRAPVFFGQAVQRLSSALGPCTWLEAGSDSSITAMVRRALPSAEAQTHSFLGMSTNRPTACDSVRDTTLQLWRQGHSVQYWNFHRHQAGEYETLRLPSYQFEKNRHWLDLLAPAQVAAPASSPNDTLHPELPPTLVTLIEKAGDSGSAVFRVDPQCEEYKMLVSGHCVAGSALCPATVYIEMAARACRLLVPVVEGEVESSLLSVRDLNIGSPCGMATDREMSITLKQSVANTLAGAKTKTWSFSVTTSGSGQSRHRAQPDVLHCEGIVELQESSGEKDIQQELERYEKLIDGTERIESLYRDIDSESIRGKSIYKMFSRVVVYADCYQGIKSVAARDNRIAGTVAMPDAALHDAIKDTITQPPLMDSFMQVAGLHANNIYPCDDADVYVFTKMDRLQFGPGFRVPPGPGGFKGKSWKIFSNLTAVGPGNKELANDIFVFDSVTGRLVLLIFGARFTNVRLKSLTKVLSSINDTGRSQITASHEIKALEKPQPPPPVATVASKVPKTLLPANPVVPDASTVVFNDICRIVENVAEVPRNKIQRSVSLEDVGVDSLMMMEVISEISGHFAIELPIEDLLGLPDVGSFTDYLVRRGCASSAKQSSMTPPNPDIDSVESDLSDVETASTSTPPSSMFPTPAESPHSSDVVPKLAALLQEHLELAERPELDANLADLGLDSLLCIELASDIATMFSVQIDMYQLDEKSTLRDLVGLVRPASAHKGAITKTELTRAVSTLQQGVAMELTPEAQHVSENRDATLVDAQQKFEAIRYDFDRFSEQQSFANFWTNVYPDQAVLVLSYIGDAFKKLGVDLSQLAHGVTVPALQGVLPKHTHLVKRLHKILADGGYVTGDESQSYAGCVRTSKPFDLASPQALLRETIRKYPVHEAEHLLLNVTGSRLAECLTGRVDPLQILFANKANRQLLADVYDKAPMCQATTQILATFLVQIFSSAPKGRTFHLLEVGGGTGGTTRFLIDFLSRHGFSFTYTFTDISSALVGGAKKKFAGYDCMRYLTLDCEQPPPPEQVGKYHVIISTNCIHATRNATASLKNLRQMLRPEDGLMALVEFTKGLYWFDLVYGLLDGWWLFDDGRNHALADVDFWDNSLRQAGYKQVGWTDGPSIEAKTLRLICGFTTGSSATSVNTTKPSTLAVISRRAGIPVETVVWKREGNLELCADIYYPAEGDDMAAKKRPVALLIHGGGHIVFSRKDIHMKHIKMLLQRGFLPVSTDYRLCPETTLANGPMADSVDALRWVRESLPQLLKQRTNEPGRPAGVQIDTSKVAAVGWSSGGHLAMTLGYAAGARGVQPPDVILAFYCPSNFEAEWWRHPIYPKCVKEAPGSNVHQDYDLLEGVRDEPLTGYLPSSIQNEAPSLAMTLQDARWRLIIHMNWNAQLVPLLVKGLPTRQKALQLANQHATTNMASAPQDESWDKLSMPSLDEIRAVSPYAQIVQGNYRTPTFIVHGRRDDLIPWEQSQETINALRDQGVEAGIAVPDAGHAFDLFKAEDPMGTGWGAVHSAYEFLCRHVSSDVE